MTAEIRKVLMSRQYWIRTIVMVNSVVTVPNERFRNRILARIQQGFQGHRTVSSKIGHVRWEIPGFLVEIEA